MHARPLGRPRIDREEKLGEHIGIVVSRATREQLERQAREAGYRSLSCFIREKLEATMPRS